MAPRLCRSGRGRPASGNSTVLLLNRNHLLTTRTRAIQFHGCDFSNFFWVAAGVIFPSLLQLPSGITELDDRKQRRLCLQKFRKVEERVSEVDLERELECGICLEVNAKIVLPDCAHSLCMRCFEDW